MITKKSQRIYTAALRRVKFLAEHMPREEFDELIERALTESKEEVLKRQAKLKHPYRPERFIQVWNECLLEKLG